MTRMLMICASGGGGWILVARRLMGLLRRFEDGVGCCFLFLILFCVDRAIAVNSCYSIGGTIYQTLYTLRNREEEIPSHSVRFSLEKSQKSV